MLESVESRVKQLEKAQSGSTEPVKFRVFYVEQDVDGFVWRTDAKGKLVRVDPKTIGIELWTPPDTTMVERVIEEQADPPPQVNVTVDDRRPGKYLTGW